MIDRCLLLRGVGSGVAVLSLCACAARERPTIRVDSATLVPAATEGHAPTLLVRLLASNPSDQPVPLREVRYIAEVDGMSQGLVARDSERTIPRFGTQVLEVPVPLSEGGVPGRVLLRGEAEYVPYESWRRTLFEAGLRVPSVGFAGEVVVGK